MMKGFRISRPSTNTIYDGYHVLFDDTVIYGDFMGKAYQERIRADTLQRIMPESGVFRKDLPSLASVVSP